MDFTELRIAFTVLTFLGFVGIVIWAYSKGAQSGFEAAARLPLDEPTAGPNATNDVRGRQ